MAKLDFSRATALVDMLDVDIVKFSTVEAKTSTSWSFRNSDADLQLDGNGMTFDSKGKATGGTVTRIGIDLGDNDFDNPDILITGIKAKATMLDNGAIDFWGTLLAGNDVIVGPSNDSVIAPHVLFGDGAYARNNTTGGNDRFELGADPVNVVGDVSLVGVDDVGAPAVAYRGGNDVIRGAETIAGHLISGDVTYVNSGSLVGGHDSIFVRSIYLGGRIVGDAEIAGGSYTKQVRVSGGNDTIIAGDSFDVYIYGDVYQQYGKSIVRGGDDQLHGGAGKSYLIGDVGDVRLNQAIGGNDVLWGEGDDDVLIGDAYQLGSGGKLTGGHDILHGGTGYDFLYGDATTDTGVKGGNDRLFGEEGQDILVGGGGNDYLDGGSETDQLMGGTGNDTYVVDDDNAFENAGEGTDTVISITSAYGLGANFENLTYKGADSFTGNGNELANVIRGGLGADTLRGYGAADSIHGGAGSDDLYGGEGNDILTGGAGGDYLQGNEGFDVASYAGSEQGVRVSLDGSVGGSGHAAGDMFGSIEGLRGTSYADLLVGDTEANTLEGGRGIDTLTGGAGKDRFIFRSLSDSGTTASTRDLITDYKPGHDFIDLYAIDADMTRAGNNDFTLLARGTEFSAVGTGKIGWYHVNKAGTADDLTILRLNTDADSAIEMTIAIKGFVNLTANDFVI